VAETRGVVEMKSARTGAAWRIGCHPAVVFPRHEQKICERLVKIGSPQRAAGGLRFSRDF
jgi:hypothetical protein